MTRATRLSEALYPGQMTRSVLLALVLSITACAPPPESTQQDAVSEAVAQAEVTPPPSPTEIAPPPPVDPPVETFGWVGTFRDMRAACENQVFKQYGYIAPFMVEGPARVNQIDGAYLLSGFIQGQSGSVDVDCISTKAADYRLTPTAGKTEQDIFRSLRVTAPLTVESWRCQRASSDYMKVLGEVTNTSTDPMENVTANAQIRDSSGLLAKEETLIDYKLLRPGETSPFEVLIDTGGRSGDCYVSFGYFMGDPIQADFPPDS